MIGMQSRLRPGAVVLALSLALNVLLAASLLRHMWLAGPGRPTPESLVEEAAGLLPPDDASIVHDAYAANGIALVAHMRELDSQSAELRALLRTDPFDEQTFMAALDHISEQHSQTAQEIRELLQGVVPRLSRDGRRRLAEWSGALR